MRLSVTLLSAGFALAAPALTSAQFENPQTPAFAGTTGAEFSAWDCFTIPFGAGNAPDDPETTSDDAFVQQNTPGAIITSTCNIYHPFDIPTYTISDSGPGDLVELHFQFRALGNPIDVDSAMLSYVDSSSTTVMLPATTLTDVGAISGQEVLYTWDLSGIADEITSYEIGLASTGNNTSLDGVLLNSLWDVNALESDVDTISASLGGTQTFSLDAGSQFGGELYFFLGSASGTAPGFSFQGFQIDLNPDFYTNVLASPNPGFFPASFGSLDGAGRATAQFIASAGFIPGAVTIHHAYAVLDASTGTALLAVSNSEVLNVTF
ncbi:MAG: hypothetical protein AAF682_16785 [Planctomycetota bacterium]